MVMMLSFGTLLTIAMVVFAGYGVLYWLFGGSRPAMVAPPVAVAPRRSTPTWLTPVILIGMVVFVLRAGMPFWSVVLGSVFTVAMLVKLNVLSFTGDPTPGAPVPPPLPRDARFQNATYHPTYAPPPTKSSFGAAAAVAAILLVIGLTLVGVLVVREERVRPATELVMVAQEGWNDTMHEVHSELKQGMHELKQELKSGAHELAMAAKESVHAVRSPPPMPVPPATAINPPNQPTIVINPAIPPTQPDRINKVLGRNGVTVIESSSKPKKAPKAQPKPPAVPVVREPAVRVDYDRTKEELADFPTDKSPNGVYVILTDPKDPTDDCHAAFQRALVLFKNHLMAKHSDLAYAQSINLPSYAWCEANGLIHERIEPLDNVKVHALGTNFSPKAMDLAYNYHLGCERTREAAKGYFGGLLVLGGLGLLLRIGTGIRPTAPIPKV